GTDCSPREHLLHRCPVRFDPAAIMTAVAVRWNADLRERQSRTPRHPTDVENGDGVVIRPPVRGAPGLDDLLARPQGEGEAREVRFPRGEAAADLFADHRLLARE